ncbi:hypothetical protein GCM10007276_17360 [Agaricicola taiwanensis]|uniref:Flagellar protein FlaG n=1 Tax=Agaricicola taiwanensis TaxID=591372 RepID=A0A8J2VYC7_9RHOB|nr:hypothetical protein [Agaricicola taiwanensis]GGE40541.1 hypothetical protein GCM10007276_17360 [Agaricicola taiwanensis]
MDAAYPTKAMPPLPPTRTDLTPSQQSVTTDLPQEKSVAMISSSQGMPPGGTDPRARSAVMHGTPSQLPAEARRQATREVKVEVDESTNDFVYKTIDGEGDLISQFPNETMMKIRAYVATESSTSEEIADAAPQDQIAHVERRV